MQKNRSIKQRLIRAKSAEAKKNTVENWVNDWEQEQRQLLLSLGKAYADDDYDTVCKCIGQLTAVTIKRFEGLHSVINHLLSSDSSQS